MNYKKLANIDLKEIDYTFISNLDLYLKTVYVDRHGENIGINYVSKQHSRVRTVLHKALQEGVIINNPYSKFILKNEKTSCERLTEEELEQLQSHSFHSNKSLEKVRDSISKTLFALNGPTSTVCTSSSAITTSHFSPTT